MKLGLCAAMMVVVVAAGCSTRLKNVAVSEPQDGERVRVRVAIVSPGTYRRVRAYPNASCYSWRNPGNGNVVNNNSGFEKTFKRRKIGIPDTEFSRNRDLISGEFYARANEPIVFSHARMSDTSIDYSAYGQTITNFKNGCSSALTFTPEGGHDYELVFPGNCGFFLNQLDMIDGHLVQKRLTAEPGVACKDNADDDEDEETDKK